MELRGIRTPDLCSAIAALSHLSYSPDARLFTCAASRVSTTEIRGRGARALRENERSVHARRIRDRLLRARTLQIRHHRLRRHVVAGGVPGRQYAQRRRALDLEHAGRADRAGAAADPALPAQHRRRRHFARRRVPADLLVERSSSSTSSPTCSDHAAFQDRHRPFLRGFPDRRDACAMRRRARCNSGDASLYSALYGRASPCRAPRPSLKAIGYPTRRSTTCWRSMSCSARPCPTCRSTRSPISATPTGGSSSRSIPATR